MQNIPDTPKGRIEWLKKPDNRNSIKRRGAGSIYYRGDLSNIDSIEIIVSTRSNSAGGGLAHFGGMGEDEDVVPNDEMKTGVRNALREGQEEIEELLGYRPTLNENNYTFLYASHDDKGFIRNPKWSPVDARIHMYKVDDELWQSIFPDGEKISNPHPDYSGPDETAMAEVLTLKQALARQEDYHYPHEYFSLFLMAGRIINIDVIDLANDINNTISPARIDFTRLAKDMNTNIEGLEKYLGSDYKGKLQEYELHLNKTTDNTQKMRPKR